MLEHLRLARGAQDERTLELARRAFAFGGGADAEALLERIRRTAADGERKRRERHNKSEGSSGRESTAHGIEHGGRVYPLGTAC